MDEAILVTGGLGMIGAQVCRALVEAGRRPVIYDAGADVALLGEAAARCTLVRGGLDDLPRLLDAVRSCSPAAILHFAARVGADAERHPWSAIQTNLAGTAAVFECARLSGVPRVVFPSSKNAYGDVLEPHRHPTYLPVPESHPREPTNLYGTLKRSCEDVAAHYAARHGLDIVAFRFGSSFGPGLPGRSGALMLLGLIEAAIDGRPWRAERGADQCDDVCYAGEAARATLAALEAPAQPGRFRAYNVSGGELLSLARMIAILQSLYPGWDAHAGPGLDYRGIGVAQYFRMDTGRARAELGWRPAFDFRAAVLDYARQRASLR
jgi:nucleoside-diphosphate-sugar epimerase